MNRDIFTVEIDGYKVNGDAGEKISWRNVHGYCCNNVSRISYSEDGYGITPAGVYNITVTSVDPVYTVKISSGDSKSFLSPSIETVEDIVIFPGTNNTHVIPGLSIALFSITSEDDVFQIIVGGIWLESESRIVKKTMIDYSPSGTVPSSSTVIRITNDSGKDLRDVHATIVNPIFSKQDQYLYDLLNPSGAPNYGFFDGYRTLDPTQPIPDLEGEQLVRATSNSSPYRIVTSITGISDDPLAAINTTFDDAFYPFSNLGCTYEGTDRMKGLVLDPFIYSASEISYEPDVAPYVRIDVGRGNTVTFNRWGISAENITGIGFYGSNDDSLEPNEWDEIDKVYVFPYRNACYCYHDYTGIYPVRVLYRNIVNFKTFRHLKIAFLSYYQAWFPPFTPEDRLIRLGRVELIVTPDRDESLYRNRPFVYFDQEELDTIFYSNDDPLYIYVDNVSTTADIYVDNDGYDVYDYDSRKIYEKGVGLTLDKKYVFAETTPLAGMVFKINEDVISGDYCKVWISQGQSIFQLRKYDNNTGWDVGRKKLLLSSGTNEEGVLNDGEYCDIEIRSLPTKEIEGSEINPVEGLLYVSGLSDQEFDPSVVTKDYGTLDKGDDLKYGTIRIRVKDILYSGDMVRFKFKSVTELEIDNVYFGVAYTDIPNFYNVPEKVQVTFDDGTNSTVTLGTSEEKWTDWVSFKTDGDSDYLLSYSGSKIGNTVIATPAYDIETYHQESFIADVTNFGEDYTEYALPFDVEEIEVKSFYKGSTIIPLNAIVNQGIKDPLITVTLIPTDITNALEDFGISWEEIS